MEAGGGADEGYQGVGVEEVDDAGCCDLIIIIKTELWLVSCVDVCDWVIVVRSGGWRSYVSAADEEDTFIPNLPGEDEGAAGGYRWVVGWV